MKTLVGFGDWSNTDTAGVINECPAGPVKKLEQQLTKTCTVYSVDEYCTSKNAVGARAICITRERSLWERMGKRIASKSTVCCTVTTVSARA